MSSVHANVKALVDRLRAAAPPDEVVPDLVADLQAAERELKQLRLSLIDEAPGPVEGEAWKLVETRSASRSYNPSRILLDFAAGSHSIADTLIHLIEVGVVRLSWQWSALRKEADREAVELTIAPREIQDGDPAAHVGEVWSTKLEPKPK